MRPDALLGAATGLVAHIRCGLWGWLANVHSRRALRACVARIDRRGTGENNRCVSAPHNDIHRCWRERHGWRGLLRSGRVVGSRQDGGSSAATGLVRLRRVQTWVPGWLWPLLRMAKCVSRERREEAEGRAWRQRDIAFAHRARNDPCDECSVVVCGHHGYCPLKQYSPAAGAWGALVGLVGQVTSREGGKSPMKISVA